MISLLINGLAASAGGGLTYLRNVVPHLARRTDAKATLLLSPALRREFGEFPNLNLVETAESPNAVSRFIREQTALPKLIRRSGAQVLVSAGNFALWNSPVPQVLLSRNSLYTSRDFLHDLRSRGEYSLWVDTVIKGRLAKRSIECASATVAPSAAFAQELRQWSGKTIIALHHGFDPGTFAGDASPLPPSVQMQLEQAKDSLRLLFVSHYNYYRNFETLFRAMPILIDRLRDKVKLFLTCQLESGNPGHYRTKIASSLINDLRLNENIIELGAIPYRSLHHLYRACGMYVTPAYAESFAHPLIEAMSSGLPVVASDLPVHREICGAAAVYFNRFSSDELAERVLQVHQSPDLARELAAQGLRRARDFSWSEHVERLVELAKGLVRPERKAA